jgi:hypothetical protein
MDNLKIKFLNFTNIINFNNNNNIENNSYNNIDFIHSEEILYFSFNQDNR